MKQARGYLSRALWVSGALGSGIVVSSACGARDLGTEVDGGTLVPLELLESAWFEPTPDASGAVNPGMNGSPPNGRTTVLIPENDPRTGAGMPNIGMGPGGTTPTSDMGFPQPAASGTNWMGMAVPSATSTEASNFGMGGAMAEGGFGGSGAGGSIGFGGGTGSGGSPFGETGGIGGVGATGATGGATGGVGATGGSGATGGIGSTGGSGGTGGIGATGGSGGTGSIGSTGGSGGTGGIGSTGGSGGTGGTYDFDVSLPAGCTVDSGNAFANSCSAVVSCSGRAFAVGCDYRPTQGDWLCDCGSLDSSYQLSMVPNGTEACSSMIELCAAGDPLDTLEVSGTVSCNGATSGTDSSCSLPAECSQGTSIPDTSSAAVVQSFQIQCVAGWVPEDAVCACDADILNGFVAVGLDPENSTSCATVAPLCAGETPVAQGPIVCEDWQYTETASQCTMSNACRQDGTMGDLDIQGFEFVSVVCPLEDVGQCTCTVGYSASSPEVVVSIPTDSLEPCRDGISQCENVLNTDFGFVPPFTAPPAP